MNLKSNIDSVLSNGVHSGSVPGVIAAVANREGVIYEGAFGERSLGSGSAMTNDTAVSYTHLTLPTIYSV